MSISILIILVLLIIIVFLLIKIDELNKSVKIDHLTRLLNKRQFEHDYYETEYKRDTDPKYLLIIDVNSYKLVNDTHGHNYGDQYLKTIAKELIRYSRSTDKIYRIGGDEFAVLTNYEGLSKRYKQNILGISLGQARITNNKVQVFNQADYEMYRNKRGL